MSSTGHVSLINLGQQLEFNIDDEYKNNICFAETLVISCGHTDGVFEDDEGPESAFTCSETSVSVVEEEVHAEPIEIKDFLPDEPVVEDEEILNFQFYFFPDCKQPKPAQNSECSIITVDGWPAITPETQKAQKCTCPANSKVKCECFTRLPCKCGARRKENCNCADLQLDKICICDENKPNVKCTCHNENNDICTCFPGLPRLVCKCEEVVKPCICKHSGKLPNPVCDCKTCSCQPYIKYPKMVCDCDTREYEESCTSRTTGISAEENVNDYATTFGDQGEPGPVPCTCQKPDPEPPCLCQKGKDCKCKLAACICGVQKNCVCEPTESKDEICRSQDSKSICSCPTEPKVCTCDAKETDCKCFPKPGLCPCGDPANCKCKLICECADPCVCDITPKKEEECICLDRVKKKEGLECQCICKHKDDEPNRKLKKVRAGKEGYRWCQDVDPKHNYFDYSYGKHDKIDYKEQLREKLKILGLYEEVEKFSDENAECPVHPKSTFKRKVRKPSIDCCSAVGGISINVECLGEERDRFLIQVVSHSSREGAKTGSKIISIVDCNLHTMEENRIEHITKNGLTKERRSYMAICESGYYNKITRICGERNVVKRFYHTFEVAHDFLLEGSNVVFLRYLALRRHKGRVKTLTVLLDGTICESNYQCIGVNQAVVNGKTSFVYKVERHIIEPSGVVHQTRIMLTLKGYIVSHEWADSNYLFHINPLLEVIPEKDEIEPHAPLRENWRKDLQLFSDYLDFKSQRSSEGGRYLAENGEMTSIVRDYLQAVLLLKPADVVHFTRHYFHSALSAIDLPHDEYFDPCPKHVRYFYMDEQ